MKPLDGLVLPSTDLTRAARNGWAGEIGSSEAARPAPVLIDALFGTGLSRALDAGTAQALRHFAKTARILVAADVLADIATAILGRELDAPRAACAAVWLHGEAARHAGVGFVADDLCHPLPAGLAAATR